MADTPNRRLTPSGPPLGGDRAFVHHRRSWWERHRALIAAVVATVLVVGGTTVAVLATRNYDDVPAADASVVASLEAPSSPAAAPTTAKPTASTPAPPAAPPKTSAKGKVVAVVSEGKWTLSVEHGLDLTVVASAATKFAHNRTAGDVRKGSTLSVVGTMTGGVITASSVSIEKGST